MLIESLKTLISKETESQRINKTFITLLQVAQEDKGVRDQIIKIINLDQVNRKRVVDLLVVYLKSRNAPKDFIDAILSLEKDSIVHRIREVLEGI